MHQNFLSFVHHDDVVGFERCLRRSTRAVSSNLLISNQLTLIFQNKERNSVAHLQFLANINVVFFYIKMLFLRGPLWKLEFYQKGK